MTDQIVDGLARGSLAFAAVLLAGCIALEVWYVTKDMWNRRR